MLSCSYFHGCSDVHYKINSFFRDFSCPMLMRWREVDFSFYTCNFLLVRMWLLDGTAPHAPSCHQHSDSIVAKYSVTVHTNTTNLPCIYISFSSLFKPFEHIPGYDHHIINKLEIKTLFDITEQFCYLLSLFVTNLEIMCMLSRP